MDDARGMCRRQRAADLKRDVDRLCRGDRTRGQPCTQRLSVDVLRGDEIHVSDMADVVNGQDVRMVQRRNRARLLLKSAHPILVGDERTRQNLEGDLPPQAEILGEIDLPHAAGAERRDHAIVGKLLTGSERGHAAGLSLVPVSAGSTGALASVGG